MPFRRRARHGSGHGSGLGSVILLLLLPAFLSSLPGELTRPGLAREPAAQDEPWIVEGARLEGARSTGTDITAPRITQGALVITADRGRLTPERDLVTLRGNVRIEDTLRVTTSRSGMYNRITRRLDLAGNVRGRGPEGLFTAGDLTWDRREGRLVLRDDPSLSEPTRILWADRIEMMTEERTGDALGNVRILLLPDTTWVYGREAHYQEAARRTVLTGDPRMVTPSRGSDPEMEVLADTLILDEARRSGEALGRVRIRRGGLRASGRRALFQMPEDRILLYGEPVAWDPDGEIRADTMAVSLSGGEADQLRAFGGVTVRYEPREKPGEQNFVVGDTLVAGLRDGAVTDMEVRGNAASLYLPSLSDLIEGSGRNISRGRTIHVYLDRGEARRVDLIRNASGLYNYPSAAIMRALRDPEARDSLLAPRPDTSTAAADPADSSDAETAGAPADTAAFAAAGAPADTAAFAAAGAPADTAAFAAAGAPADTAAFAAAGAPADTAAFAADSSATADRPSSEGRMRKTDRPGPSEGGMRSETPGSREWEEFAPPPEPPPILAHFLRTGEFQIPDSLASPFDRLFDERVAYQGDSIRFHVPESRIQIRGSGVVRYRGNELDSEEINFYADRELITALGAPTLSDPENTVKGEKMTYRTDQREGLVYQGRTQFDGGFYYGERIKKMSGDVLLVKDGDYTTCSDTMPHYHFHSSRMKLLIKDKAVARPVILYIKNIPIMALPYYVFPIRKGRHSGIMMPDVELGFGDSGRFVRNLGYYWAISDYMDVRSWVDYYDRGPKIYFNGLYRYKVRYLLDGNAEGSYLREKDTFGGERLRWSFKGDHRHQLGRNASLTARADFTSDKTFRGEQDFGAGVDERLNRQLKSNMSLRKSWSRLSMTIGANRIEYLDEVTASGVRIQQDGPSIDVNLNSSSLGRASDAYGQGGRLGFLSTTYLGTSWAYRNTYTRRFDGSISAKQAARQNLSLSDTRSLGSFLRLRPSLSGTWAWFARDNRKEKNQVGASWSGSVSAGNTIYGTAPEILGTGVSLRHVVEPSVSWSYSPELKGLTYTDSSGVERSRFPSVGGIGLGSGRESSSMSLRLSQRFHAKWVRGERTVKKENLLTWDTSTSYNFLAEAPISGGPERPWSSWSNSISLRPVTFFESSASTSHDPYTRAPTSFRVSTGLRLTSNLFTAAPGDTSEADTGLDYGEYGETDLQGSGLGNKGTGGAVSAPFAWNLNLSHSYSTTRGAPDPSNTLNLGFGFNPTTNWKVNGGIYFDLQERDVVSHSLTLYRDLHCWEFRFEQRSTGSRSEYFFRISIKEIPDVQYQREDR